MPKLFCKQDERSAFHIKNLCIFAGILLGSILLCIPLSTLFNDNNPFSTPVFILAVALIARFTNGYLWGIVSALFGVFCVNYMFTYPYWQFDMTLSGYPLTFASMLIVSILISTLTTQIKQQEKLRHEREMQETTIRLLRSVSHDLNTPLTTIIGLGTMLIDEPEMPAEQRREKLRDIVRSAGWLSRISENILSVTRFNRPLALHTEPQVLEELISDAILRFRRFQQDIPISVQMPPDILVCNVDATLIEQVILNLLENVVLHARGATRISIYLQSDGPLARLSVCDDGPGFPPELLPKLFNGFAMESLADENPGSSKMGIGLSSCHTIIQAHQGTIQAVNRPEGGACISFTLPLSEETSYDNH